jgi:uncharacterized damage-inducible protein DinB
MEEIEAIVDELQRAFKCDAWHGPALLETLEPVDASLATKRPIAGVHSVWEIVVHVSAWKRHVTRRLTSSSEVRVGDEEDWRQVGEQTVERWHDLLKTLRTSHLQLIETIRKFAPSKLDETVPGKDYSFRVMLHGCVQHDVYHAGQISLLTRASQGQNP